MKKAIYKYTLNEQVNKQTIEMPRTAKILSIQNQNDKITIWAEVDLNIMGGTRTFNVVTTGHDFPELAVYRATVQIGAFVWHVFEVLG